MLDVGDLEYEDEDSSSDDEEGVRRYLRANGMGRGLQQMTKVSGYTCKPSCMKKFSKCRTSCKVGNGNTRCVGGHLPGKCKNNCCQQTSSKPAGTSFNGIPGTSPFLPTVPGGPLPYCPNGSWHFTGMSACMASQVPMPPSIPVCPSGTIGFVSGVGLCVVW